MTVTPTFRDYISKLESVKRQTLVVSELILGGLVIQNWTRISDKNVANVSDAELKHIMELHNENFAELSDKRFTIYMRFFKKTTYAYIDEHEVRGYCLYLMKPSLSLKGLKKTAILYSFAVDSRYRRQGIGARLLQKSIHEMRLNSVNHIILHVTMDNEPAVNLYRKVGFKITEELSDVCGQGKRCYQMEINFNDKVT